ncbi:MAG: hypothetical protein HYX47_21610 [Burkholderiales bacterium]|nr:hypothetical protein [Burkholderiales bacterium]
MLRKLIALAITSGLAKKAWDMYQEKNGARPTASAGKARRKPASPVTRRRVKPASEKS